MLNSALYWTKHRQQIVTWLGDNAPSFKDGYVAAVEMFNAPDFPARVQLVSHIVRDIYHFLPEALGRKTLSRPGQVFPPLVKELVAKCDTFPPSVDRNPVNGSDSNSCVVRLHNTIYRQVVTIVTKSRRMAEQPRIGEAFASALFQHCHRSTNEFIPNRIVKSFVSARVKHC